MQRWNWPQKTPVGEGVALQVVVGLWRYGEKKESLWRRVV